MSRIYRLERGQELSARDRDDLARALREGETAAFPTDTVYGLGTSALSPEGIRRIYEIKGRDSAKPLPIFVHSTEEARRWTVWTSVADRLADRYWPGALTMVLRPSEEGKQLLSPGAAALAVRVPDHQVVLRLLEASGVPWSATSANLSGQPALCGAAEVVAAFSGKVDRILAAGTCGGTESTVVEAYGKKARVLREGAIRL
ncbi:MAG: L-threonylcarbamoyladenylate synthase [Elusimicrobiota bacterium]